MASGWLATLSPEERRRKKRQYRAAYRAKHPGEHIRQVRKWQLANKDKRRAASKKFYDKNRERYRGWKRAARYGLDEENFRALLEGSPCCQICQAPFDDPSVRKCIDHDHATGAVRGILCNSCNGGLGLFRDSITRLLAAVKYLGAKSGG